MKRIVSVLLILCLVAGGLPDLALAEGEPIIRGDTVSASNGDTVEYTVYIENNPGILTYLINISTEVDWMYFDEAEAAGEYKNTGTLTSSSSQQSLNVAWFNADAVNENGALFTFKVHLSRSTPGGIYPINIAVSSTNTFDGNGKELAISVVSGNINVTYVPVDNTAEQEIVVPETGTGAATQKTKADTENNTVAVSSGSKLEEQEGKSNILPVLGIVAGVMLVAVAVFIYLNKRKAKTRKPRHMH